ncbi:MAG: hypothetical protein VST69_04815 [Nitrospirota bacterium]|nr:hypothetical protein [Nitrospirota bacterium]
MSDTIFYKNVSTETRGIPTLAENFVLGGAKRGEWDTLQEWAENDPTIAQALSDFKQKWGWWDFSPEVEPWLFFEPVGHEQAHQPYPEPTLAEHFVRGCIQSNRFDKFEWAVKYYPEIRQAVSDFQNKQGFWVNRELEWPEETRAREAFTVIRASSVHPSTRQPSLGR